MVVSAIRLHAPAEMKEVQILSPNIYDTEWEYVVPGVWGGTGESGYRGMVIVVTNTTSGGGDTYQESFQLTTYVP